MKTPCTSTEKALEEALYLASNAIENWEDEREKVCSLVTCLVARLGDGSRILEWNIARVIEGMLEDCNLTNYSRQMVSKVKAGYLMESATSTEELKAVVLGVAS